MSVAYAFLTAGIELATPAGRCDRKGLLLAAILLLTAQVGMAVLVCAFDVPHDRPAMLTTSAALLWLSTTAVAKRLHDLSLSAWRILWAAVGIIVWSTLVGAVAVFGFGPESVEPGASGMAVVVLATMAPVFALTLWLHFKRGHVGANEYGPEPGHNGFSRWRATSAEAGAVATAG